jgi:hypothetical protein
MQRVPREHRSEQELLADLRALVRSRPTITSAELFRTRIGREAIIRFGSGRAAADRIAIPGWPRRTTPLPSADAVLRSLLERHRRGSSLTWTVVLREDPRLVRAANKRFGTWGAAMHEAGLGDLVGRRLDSSARRASHARR